MAEHYFIGLMTGTSLDAFDAALIAVDGKTVRYIASAENPMPQPLRHALFSLYSAGNNELERAAQAAWQHSEESAKVVHKLLKETGLSAADITALGSHGQTLRHAPSATPPYSVQIQNPALLAERTGIDVIADFRARDIACGGQGAPLAPLFHRGLLGEHQLSVVNIGGIANISVLTENEDFGFDIGPGNGLMDNWISKHLQRPYDTDGEWARSGKILGQLLNALSKDPFFSLPPPKSSGRDSFNLAWIESHLRGNKRPEDVQRTLLELTASSIAEALIIYGKSQKILLAGGGAKNLFLRERIAAYLPTDWQFVESPIPEQSLESAGFAWLAAQFVSREALPLHKTTGGKTRILGALYPA